MSAYSDRLKQAAAEYIARQHTKHPDGRSDNGGRWWPSDAEWQECCNKIRTPSRAWPWSLYKHCHTYGHIAHLFNVKKADLMKAAKEEKA